MLRDIEEKVNDSKSKVKFTKDILKKFISGLIIFAVIVLNGFLSFMSLGGMDFSAFLSSAFWLNYILLVSSEIVILLCLYVFRKSKNLKDEEILTLSDEIKGYRTKIFKLNLPKSVAEWLRNFYNPREKVNLFEDKLIAIQEKLNFNEPFEVDKDDKKAYKKYLKEKKRYEKNLKIYNWTNHQLGLVKIYKQKLEFQKNIVIERAKINKEISEEFLKECEENIIALEAELEKQGFDYKNFKIKYENVYWDTLTSNEYEINAEKRPKAQFHEKKIVLNKIWSKVLLGLTFTLIFSSMLPPLFNEFSWNTVVELLIKLILFLLSGFSGIILADTAILFYYKSALGVRKTIYNEVNYDLGINKIEIQEVKKEG